MLLDCGHDAEHEDAGTTVCDHLRTKQTAADVTDTVAYFTGVGIAYEVICAACAQARDAGAKVDVFALCEICRGGPERGFQEPRGRAGSPEILEDPHPLDTRTFRTDLPAEAAPTVSVASIDGTRSCWLLLADDGRILRWDAASGACDPVGRTGISAADVPTDAFTGHRAARRILASRDGRYAAVVVDYGSRGEVLDRAAGRLVLSLDGGDHCPETVPFAVAFIRWQGRDALIHRTDWNRLDVTDLASGENLTVRSSEPEAGTGRASELHGDFFRGDLHVDPTYSRIADDGWAWSPLGILRAWDVEPWLAHNAFESEDGPSSVAVTGAPYHWNRGCVRLDERTLAVGGIGEDDDRMIPGARIFDVARGERHARRWLDDAEIRSFAGPGKPFFTAHGLLYAAGTDGLEVWDPAAGTRRGGVPDFHPRVHHRGAGHLAELTETGLRVWRVADPRV